jgi:mRNA-degrading endonuclease RelE of RelBE toxin-antitoxin system
VYSVQINPSAWTQLAHLPVDSYRRLREALDAVAARLTESQAQGMSATQVEPGGLQALNLEGLVVRYEVDHALRRVLLLEVGRE